MKVGAIDAGRIEAMMNQLKLAAQKTQAVLKHHHKPMA